MQAYEILVGVGRLYIAPAGTAMPALDETPQSPWRDLGETDGGVKVSRTQSLEFFSTDQRTGKAKVVRAEEGLSIETNLVSATLENLAIALGGTVTDVPPGTGTIGTRSVSLYAGSQVAEYALLFRGLSPYGDYPAQYYVPRAVVDGDIELEYKKDDKVVIPIKFEALEDLSASNEEERFGKLIAQDAEAL